MKIEVKNFGVIKKGEIDLDKKVTVFVGYNNSGKTYMSQLLWSLNSQDETFFDWSDFIDDSLFHDNSITITKELISKVTKGYSVHLVLDVLPNLFNVNNDYFSGKNFSIDFLNAADFIFDELKRKSFIYNFAYRKLNEIQNHYTGYFSFKKAMDTLVVSCEVRQFDKPERLNDLDIDISDISTFAINVETMNFFSYKEHIASILLSELFDNDNFPFFLPANRVFYPSYYKYIYSIAKEEKDLIDERLKKNASLESIKALSKRPYTKAMDGLIEKVYDLNKDIRISGHYEDLVTDLKEIIGGDIILKSAEGIAPIEFFLKLDDGTELEMYMSSSSANQLTTLFLYLKYWTEKENNFLIIDEPEENLHPENQIKLVNLLMKFADRGNKILITTHSPLITDHINNYANLSYLNEAGINMNSVIDSSSSHMAHIQNIRHKDYGVYFFDGESIVEYDISDYGAYFRDFQTATDKVKDTSDTLKENIYNSINESARKSFQKK